VRIATSARAHHANLSRVANGLAIAAGEGVGERIDADPIAGNSLAGADVAEAVYTDERLWTCLTAATAVIQVTLSVDAPTFAGLRPLATHTRAILANQGSLALVVREALDTDVGPNVQLWTHVHSRVVIATSV